MSENQDVSSAINRSCRATGSRQLTIEAAQWKQRSEAFDGLPEDVSSPFQLLTTIKRAARPMGFRSELMELLELLFMYSKEQDWDGHSRPVVWPSNARLGGDLKITARQVNYRLQALIQLGLIVAKDSPNGRRFGHRDRHDRLTEAYGFDLSLLAVRYHDFKEMVERAKAEQKAMMVYRRRITINRRAIRQLVEAGRKHNVPGFNWAVLEALGYGEKPSLMTDLGSLEREATYLAMELDKAQTYFNKFVETSCLDEADCIPNTNTTDKTDSRSTIGLADKRSPACSSEDDPAASVTVKQILAIAPRLNEFLYPRDSDDKYSWDEFVHASGHLRVRLGISTHLWDHACNVMTPKGAAIAVAITSSRYDVGEVNKPGGYLHGIVKKAENNDANLEASVWKLYRMPSTPWALRH